MASDQPDSIRIPLKGHEYRRAPINRAVDHYGKSKATSIAFACEAAMNYVQAAEKVIRRDDLTVEQKRDIAETLSVPGGPTFEVETSVSTD